MHNLTMHVHNEDLPALKSALSDGANPNETGAVYGGPGSTYPLHEALFAENVEAIQALMDAGADIQQKTSNGHTPLEVALDIAGDEGNTDPIKTLLMAGATL